MFILDTSQESKIMSAVYLLCLFYCDSSVVINLNFPVNLILFYMLSSSLMLFTSKCNTLSFSEVCHVKWCDGFSFVIHDLRVVHI